MSDVAIEIAGTFPERTKDVSVDKQCYLRHELAGTLNNVLRNRGFGNLWLSRWSRVSLKTLVHIERGMHTKKHVTVQTLYRLARTFGYDLSFRLNGKEMTCGAAVILEDLLRAGIHIVFVEGE